MRRSAVLALAAVVTLVLATAVAASAQAAASISAVGWWTTNPAASSPEGGLAVSAGPNGAISVSALRVQLSVDDIDAATLTLKEAGGVQQSNAQLQVCTTPNAWSSGPKQSFDKAPKPECDVEKAALARSPEGVWTADVSSLLASSEDGEDVALMIVPAGNGVVPVGFEVQFAPPAIDATGTSTASGNGSASSFDSSEFASPSQDSGGTGSDDFSSTGSSSFDSPSSFGSSTFTPAPSSPVPSFSSAQASGTFESSPTASETAAAAVTAAPSAEGDVPLAVPAVAPGERKSRAGQALFFVLVSAIIGVGVGFGHARLRPTGGVIA